MPDPVRTAPGGLRLRWLLLISAITAAVVMSLPGTAGAATDFEPMPPPPGLPEAPAPAEIPEIPEIQVPDLEPTPAPSFAEPGTDGQDDRTATIGLNVPDVTGDSSNVVVVILLLSVLSIAPSLLILTTSFTRIVIVMSLTRNALGIPQLPPQQVIVGLSLFLTLFVMGPTLER